MAPTVRWFASRVRRWRGVMLATALSAAAGPAVAEAPFARLPVGADVLYRVDADKLATAPAYGAFRESIKDLRPNYATEILSMIASRDAGWQELTADFPGTIHAYEMGADLDGVDLENLAAVTVPSWLVVRGAFDQDLMGQKLTLSGWGNTAPDGDMPLFTNREGQVFMTPVDASTILIAGSAENAAVGRDTSTGTLANATQGELADLIAAHGDATWLMAVRLTPEMRAKLAEATATVPQEAYTVAGLPEAMREASNLTSAVVSITGQDTAIFTLSLEFADAEAADRATTALNQAFVSAAAIGRSVAADNPKAMANIEQIEQMRFLVGGRVTGVSLPLSDEFLGGFALGYVKAIDIRERNLAGEDLSTDGGQDVMSYSGGSMNLGDEPLPDGRPAPQ